MDLPDTDLKVAIINLSKELKNFAERIKGKYDDNVLSIGNINKEKNYKKEESGNSGLEKYEK